MKIKKELKNATFEYDEETKSFTISGADELYSTVELNKVYAFAFMRFVIRMSQRNWYRKTGDKALNKEKPTGLAEHPFDAPDQAEFCYDAELDEY